MKMTFKNEVDAENEEMESFGSRKRRRLVFYCVSVYVIIVITVPLCFSYVPQLLNSTRCPRHMSFPLLNPIFHLNGPVKNNGDLYQASQWFSVHNITRDCECQSRPCIRKCCSPDEHFVTGPDRRVKCGKNPKPSPFSNFSRQVHHTPEKLADVPINHFYILFGDVCEIGKFILTPEVRPQDAHFLMTDGHIFYREKYWDTSEYCLESKIGSDVIHTFICFERETEEKLKHDMYPIFLLISSVFLIVTLIVYCVIPELRNLPGKSLMGHVSALFITDVAEAFIYMKGDKLYGFPCITLAFTIQFTFLATFFWMNVMCFDIWWVFSGLRAPLGSAKERDHKKFLMYSVYAWGVPAVIVAISLIMDLVPSIPDSFIKPGFGTPKCWFKDDAGRFLYFYLPISIVMLLNIAMFASTACKLKAHSKETKVLHSSESRQSTKADKDRFDLYLKLFVVMGINWVLELVSFYVGGPLSLWFVTDIGNALQGVLIFLIFVCKRRVLRLVGQRLCPHRGLASASTSGSGHTHSTQVSNTPHSN